MNFLQLMKVGPRFSAVQLGEIVIKLKTTADCEAVILPPPLIKSITTLHFCVQLLWKPQQQQAGAMSVIPIRSISHRAERQFARWGRCSFSERRVEGSREMETDRETPSPEGGGASAERVCGGQSSSFIAICMATCLVDLLQVSEPRPSSHSV